jgi:Type II CAAX prenyl endopeptidase Rce1-like
MPLIFLTPLYQAEGNRWLVLPLFVGTIVALSFFVGYLRIRTGSLWPAVIAHSVHNAAWFTLAAFTATSSPVVVNEYLAGDSGILILVGTALAAFWVGRTQISGRPEEARSASRALRLVLPKNRRRRPWTTLAVSWLLGVASDDIEAIEGHEVHRHP